jgi:hypothetical protein
MDEATRKKAFWSLCGCILLTASAGCTAREPVPDTRHTESTTDIAAEQSGTTPPVPTRAPSPLAPTSRNDVVVEPSAPPPAKKSPASPRRVIKPSPWQPPAVVDPVRPEVGNETPG